MLPVVDHILQQRRLLLENQRLRLQRRLLREEGNPFALPEARFVELFRLNKELGRNLCDILRPYLRISRYINGISSDIKVLATLSFYATGRYQRATGEDFNLALSQTMIHRCIHEVTDAIYINLAPIKIKFPTTLREINENKELFMERFQFPGVLGVTDCTHVAIVKPSIEEHNFVNRKGFHSLNVQIMCDANLKIININSNYPGSCHDSFIWRQSIIRDHLLRRYNNGFRRAWLIGDSGYPLEPILMTPFLNPADGSPEQRFNARICAARNSIERCIGVLKMRFRCLAVERRARYAPTFMGRIVTACAALHNMCLEYHIHLPDYEPEDDLPPAAVIINNNNLLHLANIIRQNILNQYFNR